MSAAAAAPAAGPAADATPTDPAAPAAPAAPEAPATPPAPAAPANPAPAAPAATTEDAEPWNDPTKAKAEIDRLRKENGDARVNAKNAAREEGRTEAQTALAAALAPLLGIEIPGDKPATVEELTEQVGNVQVERDAATLEAATTRVAWELGVDPAKLDYLAFKLGKGEKLDTSAADFSDKLKASVTALVAADPTLKRPGAVGVSGVENLAGSGGADTITPEAFAKMSIAERGKLFATDRAAYDKLTGN